MIFWQLMISYSLALQICFREYDAMADMVSEHRPYDATASYLEGQISAKHRYQQPSRMRLSLRQLRKKLTKGAEEQEEE